MDRKVSGEVIEIPDGVKVGKYIRQKLIENNVLNPDGSLQEDLEVRVFDRRRAVFVVNGSAEGSMETWAWPYNPYSWEYNNVVANGSSNHSGGFVFYKKEGMEYVTGVPGRRRFLQSPLECLVAVFKYQS